MEEWTIFYQSLEHLVPLLLLLLGVGYLAYRLFDWAAHKW